MNIINLSAEPVWQLHNWIPHGLAAETIVFLPDACPGKSPLPTGTAVLTRQPDWRRFAVSDCGCGMRLLTSSLSQKDITLAKWDELADRLRANKGRLGDLGGGNHFLDALLPYDDGPVQFLIHTGSRSESGHVDALVDRPDNFDREFDRVVSWAADNRAAIHDAIDRTFGRTQLVLDLPHNTYEPLADGGAIIRKGSVRVKPGDVTVIPSHMSGDVVIARATERVSECLHSLSHGTGRRMSRADCKPLADAFDFEKLRRTILIPTGVENASLRTDGPYAYRDLDECLALLEGYVEETHRLAVIAYMGHLQLRGTTVAEIDRNLIRTQARAFVNGPAFERHYAKLHMAKGLWTTACLIKCATIIGLPSGIRGLALAKRQVFDSPELRERYRRLVDLGRIVQGILILNNSSLSQDPHACAPALIVASLTGTDASDAIADDVAGEVFERILLKNHRGLADPIVAAMVADEEYQPFRRRQLPGEFTGGHVVHFLDVKIDNDLLPRNSLMSAGPLFFLVDPEPGGLVLQLPSFAKPVTPPPIPAM